MAGMDRTQQQAIWRERVGEWARSGQSVTAFCRRRHLATWSLYLWRKRLKATRAQQADQAPSFVEINLPPVDTPAWACELELKNGRKLRFQGGVPAQQLAELATALEGGAC